MASRNNRRRRNNEGKKNVYQSSKKRRTLNYPRVILAFLILFFMIFLTCKGFGILKSTFSNSGDNVNIDNYKKNESGSKTITENKKEEKKPDITINMAFTGDIMCHNTMFKDAYNSDTNEYDFSYYFDDIKYHLQTADITVGNLETTFAGSKVGYSGYPTFNTPETLAKALKNIGFDVVSTANNHCIDKGYKGIESTIDQRKNKILF